MVREILIWPDPILKKKASPVGEVNESIRALVNDKFETMYSADGVGLAAPQIGVLKNIIFLDPEGNPQKLEAEGLLAVAIQHETDHLNGTMFVDHLSALKREVIRKRMKRLKAEREEREAVV